MIHDVNVKLVREKSYHITYVVLVITHPDHFKIVPTCREAYASLARNTNKEFKSINQSHYSIVVIITLHYSIV